MTFGCGGGGYGGWWQWGGTAWATAAGGGVLIYGRLVHTYERREQRLNFKSYIHICWLPYLQNYITGNTPYGTGNATHTGSVIFKRYVTGTSAAKAGSPYPQTYFTGIAPKYDVKYR